MFGFRKLLTFTPMQEGSGMALFRALSSRRNRESNQILERNILGYRLEPTGSMAAYSGLVGACTEKGVSLVLGGIGIFRG